MSIIPNLNNKALQLLPDIALWKQQIADAINERGGNANPNSAFTQLAQDIEDIENFPSTGFEYISERYRPRTLMEAYINRTRLITVENNTTKINGNGTFEYCSSLQSIELPNLVTLSGNSTFGNCSSLQSIELPNLVTLSGNSTFEHCSSLQSIELPNLVTINAPYMFYFCSSLQSVELPNLVNIGLNMFQSCGSLQTITFGVLIDTSDPFFDAKPNLRNITIGQDTNITLLFKKWTATNIISKGQTEIDELNSNLYNNLLTKLYDHSNDGETRTLQIGWLDYVSEENIAYATAKGWTLTT